MNKIILYIATSLDGFIADINGGVDWLPHPRDDAELDAVGYKDLIERIDTILMGSRSYKQISSFGDWGWPDKHTYVFTSKKFKIEKPYISSTHDSPLEFIAKFKDRTSDKDIWLLGGSKLAQSFAEEDLIDEIILTIVPKVLGSGISLGLIFKNFELSEERALHDGMIQKIYLRKALYNIRGNVVPQFAVRTPQSSDINAMVSLSKAKRLAYENAQPQFWRYAGEEGDKAQRRWFLELLEDKNYVMFTAESDTKEILGFVIGKLVLAPEVYNPGGLTLMIDDFCVQPENFWQFVGAKLIEKIKAAAKAKGATQIVVVCGSHDHPKRKFLSEQNLQVASEWFVGGVV